MAGTLSLSRDGDQASLRFEYNNFTRNKSRNNPNEMYYTFACEGGIKCHVPAAGAEAIIANWPGKGGSMTVVRHAATSWEIKDVFGGDTQYPLQMKEWNNASREYVDVNWQPGQPVEPGSAPQQPQTAPQAQGGAQGHPPQAGAPQTQQTAVQAASAAPAVTWEDLEGTWQASWEIAWKAMAGVHGQIEGDLAGAIERAAVTIYMDARRQGLGPRGASSPPGQEMDEDFEPSGF